MLCVVSRDPLVLGTFAHALDGPGSELSLVHGSLCDARRWWRHYAQIVQVTALVDTRESRGARALFLSCAFGCVASSPAFTDKLDPILSEGIVCVDRSPGRRC